MPEESRFKIFSSVRVSFNLPQRVSSSSKERKVGCDGSIKICGGGAAADRSDEKRQDAAGDDSDKGHADSTAAAQAVAMAMPGNGVYHFDSDTANLFINDMTKQGGANRDRWIPP